MDYIKLNLLIHSGNSGSSYIRVLYTVNGVVPLGINQIFQGFFVCIGLRIIHLISRSYTVFLSQIISIPLKNRSDIGLLLCQQHNN